MLALTPVPLQSSGERSVFAELTGWDTGGSVRAAVMASIAMSDASSQRRISDAVLFVPEGLAVVRIAEVVRQSGVVTAAPEGAWSIAPESGPSQTLQLNGGGSTPLDGLMRAGMDTAMKLRRAGLEPGRIARLTVLVGNLTGLLPADGDLGEGDQVALLEPRSLLLGIARASRYAGVDNPRLWTTADVRAALEALGLEGRGPTVEELNGEGFPYSPYVLRRADLLTPASMAAASESAASAARSALVASAAGTSAVPPVRDRPAPEAADPPVIAQPSAAPVSVQRDTVAIDGPQDVDAGLGGLFAGSEPEGAPAGSSAGTSVFPAAGPPPRTSVFAAQSPGPAPAQQRFAYWNESPATTAEAEDEADESSHRGRTALLIVAGLAVVVLLGVGGWLLLGGRGGDDGSGAPDGSSATADASPGPQVGDVQTVAGTAFTVEALDLTDTCAGHAYGAVAEFLGATDCAGLARALYSTDVEGEAVVVSVVRVQMPDATAARDLRALADQNGSGNVSDLLREGVRYPGSPAELSGAEYASALSGPTVTIVETDWADEDAELGEAEIDRVAGDALALEVPPFPAA